MPYIKPDQRGALEYLALRLEQECHNPGELNFAITVLIDEYLRPLHSASYSDYNEILGVVEAVKQEFVRRRIVPYEERKREENGDVFPQS